MTAGKRFLTLLLVVSFAGMLLGGCGVVDAFKRGMEEAKEENSGSDDKEEAETEEKTEEVSEEEEDSSGTLSLFGGENDGKSEDGSEDEKKAEGSETEDVNELSDEDAEELAEFLSTTERPSITDYEFVGAALWGGNDNLGEYFGNPDAIVIHNPLLVEGDWKCVTCPIPNTYSSESSNLGNANIHSLKDKVSFTLDMWLEMDGTFEGEGKEIQDGSPVKYTGKWNDDNKGFSAETDYAMIEMEKFIYLDDTMYALGKLSWISGEVEYVVLIRPVSRMEIIDTSDWRYATTNETEDTSKKSDEKSSTKESKKSDDSKKSSKLSNQEIVELARKKSGAPIGELDSIDPDGTLNIHLYEDAGDHTATWDWYYINPDTLKGTNLMGDPVDLN